MPNKRNSSATNENGRIYTHSCFSKPASFFVIQKRKRNTSFSYSQARLSPNKPPQFRNITWFEKT